MRPQYEDVEVVSRSELVVVAHLKPGSIQLVDHGNWWENHATLVITDTLKGTAGAAEIPILIHYGLDPLFEGKVATAHQTINLAGRYPTGSVQIIDSGNSACCGPPLLADATRDNVWMLRRLGGDLGREPATSGPLGILDPEDVRVLADKDYLALYLATDPEAAVRAYAKTHVTDTAAARYLDHVDVQHILAITDATTRVDKLIPYFVRNFYWGLHDEVGEGIVAAGADAAGPRLVTLLAAAKGGMRETIISMLGRLHYRGAVDPLVQILAEHDAFWAKQQLAGDWWNDKVDSPLTIERRQRYGDVYSAVTALGQIGDKRARPAIEQTLKRWEAIKFANPQIVEACRDALAGKPATN